MKGRIQKCQAAKATQHLGEYWGNDQLLKYRGPNLLSSPNGTTKIKRPEELSVVAKNGDDLQNKYRLLKELSSVETLKSSAHQNKQPRHRNEEMYATT